MLTTRVADWYVMTDELLYERLALSVTQLHSPLPHVHGELIGNINQLYPLLLAPLLAGRLVPHGLHDAHVLNALVMSSACIPAALLARRVTGSTRLAYVVGVLTVCMPWIALSSFLMTESVAYPAFAWALLAAAQRSRVAAAPERPAPARRDRCRDPCAHAVRGAAGDRAAGAAARPFSSARAGRTASCAGRRLRRAFSCRNRSGCRRRAVARPRHLLCHGGRKPDALRYAALAARASSPARARTRNRAVHPCSCLALDRARTRADPRPARIRKYRCGHRRRTSVRGDVVRPPLRCEPFARSVPLLSRAAAADLVHRDGAGKGLAALGGVRRWSATRDGVRLHAGRPLRQVQRGFARCAAQRAACSASRARSTERVPCSHS